MILAQVGNKVSLTGKPLAHHKLVSDLLEAVLLPKQIAGCKCSAHTNNTDPISQGNSRADSAAKKASRQALPPTLQLISVPLSDTVTPTADLQELQSRATPEEKALWEKSQAHVKSGVSYLDGSTPSP